LPALTDARTVVALTRAANDDYLLYLPLLQHQLLLPPLLLLILRNLQPRVNSNPLPALTDARTVVALTRAANDDYPLFLPLLLHRLLLPLLLLILRKLQPRVNSNPVPALTDARTVVALTRAANDDYLHFLPLLLHQLLLPLLLLLLLRNLQPRVNPNPLPALSDARTVVALARTAHYYYLLLLPPFLPLLLLPLLTLLPRVATLSLPAPFVSNR